ncbi:glycosyltransferase family 2 protein [Verrucomicrobiota bacterium]
MSEKSIQYPVSSIDSSMHTPVAFLIYRRPDLTGQVFARIAEVRPPKLLVVADGPRGPEEAEACRGARAATEKVDWPCEVLREYADTNMGCRKRVATGLDWVFSQVEEAVVVEDDCLPDRSFFGFCQELLDRYRDDARVGHIGGSNPLGGSENQEHSYYFSRYPMIWGWATWRRAWSLYDADMGQWPEVRASGRYRRWFDSASDARHFRTLWDGIMEGRIDTWDAQWAFCRLLAGTLSVIPAVNMVANIGFRTDASRTTDPGDPLAMAPARSMTFPLRHPPTVACTQREDRRLADLAFVPDPWWKPISDRLLNKHFYGALIRRVPALGGAWGRWRGRRKETTV